MNRVECANCGEIVEVTGSSVVFPYVCSACLGDDTDYADEEGDDLPCDAAPHFIIEARCKFNKSYDWFRSQNPDTDGIFDDYSTALEAAEREQDGSTVEYRVVEYRREPTPGDVPYNRVKVTGTFTGVPCQSALDSVQADVYDQYAHNSDILDQFNTDTEIINDLREQLDGAHAANARLTEEIEFCDKRVRAYQQSMAETDKHAAGLEGTIEILKSELRGISIRANDAVLDTSV